MSSQGYPAVPEMLTDANDESVAGKEHRRKMAVAINRLNQGKSNCTLDITLNPGTATTISDARISYFSFLFPMPMTSAGATVEAGGIYFDTFNSGSAVLHHSISTSVTVSMRLLILG